jgi:hypothetical protein
MSLAQAKHLAVPEEEISTASFAARGGRYIGLVERDAEMVHFGEPDRTTEVPNQILFAGAGYRATVGFVIGDDVSPACLVHLREAKGFFERDAGKFLIVSSVEL